MVSPRENRPPLLQEVVQRLPLEVLHRVPEDFPPGGDSVNRNDVWMVQGGGGLRLALEALDAMAEGQFGRKDLDGDFSG